MSITSAQALRSYIADLPVGPALGAFAEGEGAVNSIDIDQLPDGLVTGSNLVQFPAGTDATLKSSIALSLLAAQRVATNDPVIRDVEQWVQRHDTVLKNLNWRNTGGGVVRSEFKSINVAVHEAILPFISAALGPAAAVGSLITTALTQLQKIEKDSPWITLFDRQARRFDVTEYQFSVVEMEGDTVRLNVAAARLDASYGRTQVLFFKVKREQATFDQANARFATEASLLADMNADLKVKLGGLTKSFIRSIPDDLLKGDLGAS